MRCLMVRRLKRRLGAPLLSRIDRRPGRLVSYVCRKPG